MKSAETDVPIVFIHRGYSWYVPYSLEAASRRLGKHRLHYIGDTYGKWVSNKWCQHTSLISTDFLAAADFAKIYRHYSTLGVEYELFCIQRWFVLRDYMRRVGLTSCIYLDTDILISGDLDEVYQRVADSGRPIGFTGHSAHTCMVHEWDGLREFCDFVTRFYQDESNRQKCLEWQKKVLSKGNGGGVSDMTLFYRFAEARPDLSISYGELYDKSPSPIDVSMTAVSDYETDAGGFKRVTWEDNLAFAHTTDGAKVAMCTLHFQGRAKKVLKQNYNMMGGSISFLPTLLDFLFKFISNLLSPGQVFRRIFGRRNR